MTKTVHASTDPAALTNAALVALYKKHALDRQIKFDILVSESNPGEGFMETLSRIGPNHRAASGFRDARQTLVKVWAECKIRVEKDDMAIPFMLTKLQGSPRFIRIRAPRNPAS